MRDTDTHALSYRGHDGTYCYIPTAPRCAQNWRGPIRRKQ